MDAYKIIKKHGVPAGVPVVTVYVDPNAPGESEGAKLYGHIIRCVGFILIVITNTNNPFTAATFSQYLYDKGFRTRTFYLPVDKSTLSTSGVNSISHISILGVYSASGNDLMQVAETEFLSVTDNVLTLSTVQVNSYSVTFSNDTVYEI